MWKDLCGLGHLAELSIEVFNRVCRVNHALDALGVAEEWSKVAPSRLPALQIRRILRPLLLDFVECFECRILARCRVHGLEIVGKLLLVLVRDEHERVAYLVHDTYLYLRARKEGFNGLWEALEPVHASDEDVLHSSVLEVVQDVHPELRSLAFRYPDAQDLFLSVQVNAERDVRHFGRNLAGIPYLEMDTIQIDDWIAGRKWAGLPVLDERVHAVGDGRDGRARELDVLGAFQEV